MPIDINLLRAFKGGLPDLVKASQAKRFAKVALVDEVISLDNVGILCLSLQLAMEKACR